MRAFLRRVIPLSIRTHLRQIRRRLNDARNHVRFVDESARITDALPIVVAAERRVAYAHQAEEAVRGHTLARLSPAAARLKDEGFHVATEVRFGDPGATVLRTADELGAGLIVLVVREGRGWRQWWAGRVEHQIIKRATVPVLAVRRHGQRAA